jgi:hypothetical protein
MNTVGIYFPHLSFFPPIDNSTLSTIGQSKIISEIFGNYFFTSYGAQI